MNRSPSRPRSRRRGYGLIEMAATGALLAAMALLCARAATSVAAQRQATTRREAAARLAANLVEEVRALPWPRITTEGVRPLAEARLAEVAALVTSRAAVRVAVDPAPGVAGTESRRIIVTVAWPEPSRGGGAPVRLAAWAFAPTATAGGPP